MSFIYEKLNKELFDLGLVNLSSSFQSDGETSVTSLLNSRRLESTRVPLAGTYAAVVKNPFTSNGTISKNVLVPSKNNDGFRNTVQQFRSNKNQDGCSQRLSRFVKCLHSSRLVKLKNNHYRFFIFSVNSMYKEASFYTDIFMVQ